MNIIQKQYKLGDLAEIGRGSSPRPITDQRYFKGGNIPWIKIADATNSGKYIYETKEHVNELGASYSRKLKPNTLIIAASGTLGFPKFLGCEGCIHDGWMYFGEINEELLDRNYLYYSLITLRSYFNKLSYGAAIQNINTPIVKNTQIFLPDLPTQKRIADVLSAYDDLIENNNKRIALLEKAAQELYKEWFVRFRFPGHEKAKFVNGLPEGWEIIKLGDFVDIKGGKRLPENKTLQTDKTSHPYIRIRDIGENKFISLTSDFQYIDDETFKIINRFTVNTGDVLISIVGTIGSICCVGRSLELANLTENCVKLVNLKELSPCYIYHFLNSDSGRGAIQAGVVGATQPKLPIYNIKRIKLLKPDTRTLELFSQNIKIIDDDLMNLQQQNQNLIKQRDLLIPRLMSGKLEV